ncbi:competence protein CoiA family protein [Halobacteriovorax sp. ZH4_bin.1]|uniref:competence protein CoiA n=1 Tax=unclassified Halobacteriovorax TaxID=2639665 RepID=UPI00371B39AC
MKFANVNGERREPSPGIRGHCFLCGSEMISKCGEKVIWHWAHKGRRTCDHYWENETDWHRAWKNLFPKEQQEVVHTDDKGEKHFADVKLDNGFVLEFQNSPIPIKELKSRNDFYKDIAWIVNGLSKRESDYKELCRLMKNGNRINQIPLAYMIDTHSSKLVREWAGTGKSVFFDFSVEDIKLGKSLWLLIPIECYEKSILIEVHLNDLLPLISMDMTNLKRITEQLLHSIEVQFSMYKQRARLGPFKAYCR